MLIFTIIMIALYTLYILFAGLLIHMDKTENKDKDTLAVLGCITLIFMPTYAVSNLIHLMFLFKIDPLIYPTLIMLILFIGDSLLSVLKFSFKKNIKKKSKGKFSIKVKLGIVLKYLFYVYALYLIIVGI